MPYQVGVDLGTTYTAAAVHRDGRAEISSLGSRAASVPSVVVLREDETVLTGEAAVRRALTEPQRVAREFKRRIGDTTPILVGGSPYSAEALMARLLRSVLEEIERQEGGPPDRIGISHPANWGAYKLDLLEQAVRLADLDRDRVHLLSEPEAAAIFYAHQQRVDPGEVVAVYDLGGGTFDAAVLRRTATGFEILGRPEGIERLGGVDFDAAVFAHVTRALGGAFAALDPDDPAAQAAVARLRQDCVEAKEALSSDTDASVPILLPNVSTEVRITRAEFEALVRPSLADSIDAMRRALRSAGVEPADVSKVLLIGGSSRIPLVAQLVSSELGRPVAVDAHPKHAVALGAAHAAARGSVAAAAPIGDPVETAPAVVGAGAPQAQDATSNDRLTAATPDPTAAGGDRPGAAVASAASGVAGSATSPSSGAGHAAGGASPPSDARAVDVVDTVDGSGGRAPSAAVDDGGAGAIRPPVDDPPGGPPAPPGPPAGRSRLPYLVGVVALLAVVAAVAVFALGGEGDDDVDTDVAGAGAGAGADATSTTAGDTTTTTAAPVPNPGEVGSGVEEAIAALGLSPIAATVDVAVADDVVTLTGLVEDESVRDAVVAAADGVDGVGEVADSLAVRPEDERCTDDIRAQPKWVCLTSVALDGEVLRAEYDSEVEGEVLAVGSGFHYHFFGDHVSPEDSGTQSTSPSPGPWLVWDREALEVPPTEVFGGGEPDKLCVRIADHQHRSYPETGNCWPIEGAAGG